MEFLAILVLIILVPLAMAVGGIALFGSGMSKISEARADGKAFKAQREFYKANPGATQQDYINHHIAQKAKEQRVTLDPIPSPPPTPNRSLIPSPAPTPAPPHLGGPADLKPREAALPVPVITDLWDSGEPGEESAVKLEWILPNSEHVVLFYIVRIWNASGDLVRTINEATNYTNGRGGRGDEWLDESTYLTGEVEPGVEYWATVSAVFDGRRQGPQSERFSFTL